MRDGNLKKQAHLLSKAELKRRGITRYDAEIILAQGHDLPEPKVDLGGKIPAFVRKNEPVKVSELRLSPRKHLSSQSYLKSLSPESTIGREKLKSQDKTRNGHLTTNPLRDITGGKFELHMQQNTHQKSNVQLNSLAHNHSSFSRSQKNKHGKPLKVDIASAQSVSEQDSDQTGLKVRHSPRLVNKEVIDDNLRKSCYTRSNSSTSVIETGDPRITFNIQSDTVPRNIFTQIQLDVGSKDFSDDKGCLDLSPSAASVRQQTCPTLQAQLKSRPLDMPLLTPYDTDPESDSSYKNSRLTPKLVAVKSSSQLCDRQHVEKHYSNRSGQSSQARLRQSPRYKKSQRKNSSSKNAEQCNSFSSQQCGSIKGQGRKQWSKSRGTKSLKGDNVFERFGCTDAGDSYVDLSDYEDVDIEGLGDGQPLNGSLQVEQGSVHLLRSHGKKRKIDSNQVSQGEFEPLSKRIHSLNERVETYKKILADISPKVPKITIKMPKDPVLVEELRNSEQSEGVHFKLESPAGSLPGTPDSSDMSDSDEEESPLICTKFRPSRAAPGSLKPRSCARGLYRQQNSVCPKLMKIRFGTCGEQVHINIPRHKDG